MSGSAYERSLSELGSLLMIGEFIWSDVMEVFLHKLFGPSKIRLLASRDSVFLERLSEEGICYIIKLSIIVWVVIIYV